MKRYKCTVSYCGAAYSGWQTQLNGTSIQEQIESALSTICVREMHITGAGRTDAKVNAWGQVFHFDTDLEMKPARWRSALNGKLPGDIRIRMVEEAEKYFHARYCVRSKCYEYRINTGEYNVFSRYYAYQCPVELDTEAMKEASAVFVGTHDFTSFNSTTLREMPNQVRTVDSIDFRREGEELVISYTGKGFLRYMVRMMSAALIDAGRHKKSADEIRNMLEERSKRTDRRNAKPEGLTLKEISYYDILSMNDTLMIREWLKDDVIPDWYRIAHQTGEQPLSFVLCERRGQRVIGVLECEPGNNAKLILEEEENMDEAGELILPLNEYLAKHEIAEKAEILIR
ncbi:MAG: tRNA pseudouridine(38-40) synthase TruA [Solobacterium sp.]|nr:tRNA pseudouridine(38-40) synthase TruA [Solobacterium sp.]